MATTVETGSVQIDPVTGGIKCKGSAPPPPPTDDEAKAIMEEWAIIGPTLPKMVNAYGGSSRNCFGDGGTVEDFRKQLGCDKEHFFATFYDRADTSHKDTPAIKMVQQRIDFKDGKKVYITWTFWSDGNWRRLEPEELSFFKPARKTSNVIVVCEGAKAARMAQRIASNEYLGQEEEA